MAKKIKSNSGETLIESLASVLVISLAIAMLAGALTASGKSNLTASEIDNFISDESLGRGETDAVTIRYIEGTNHITGYQVTKHAEKDINNVERLYFYEVYD